MIRSIFLNVAFFLVMAIFLIVGYPLRFSNNQKYFFIFWHYLSTVMGFIFDKIGGIKYVVEGKNNLLKEPAIYAVRHESTWETLVLICKFREPIFILKKELLKIPLFGIMSKKAGTIAVDRDNGMKSLKEALGKVEAAIASGHPVIIFPEGTRMTYGEYVPLKRGIALFYSKANCPVVPVIHNSGLFWPRRRFIKKTGVITVKFLDPIAPGLSKDEFMDKLNGAFSSELRKLEG